MDVDYVLVDATTVETSTAALLTAPEPAPLLSLGPCPSAIDLLAQPGDGGDLRVTARPDDVAALVFTSGSTGRPRGCAITYRALSSHWTWQPRAWSPAAAEFAMAFEYSPKTKELAARLAAFMDEFRRRLGRAGSPPRG